MKRYVAVIGLALLAGVLPETLSALAASPAQIADGKMIATMTSMGNCDACHRFAGATEAGNIGPELKAVKSMMPDRRTFYAIVYDEEVRNPQTVMPPFGKDKILTPKQINDVIDFLYTK